MKTQEEINEWLENLPQSEKAKMMFQIKKREYLDNEEANKKIVLDNFNPDETLPSETKNRIKLSDVTAEDIENAFKGIDDVFGIKIKIDDIDVINENTSSHKKLIDNNINIEPIYEVIEPKKKSIFKEILLSILYPFVAFIITSLVYVLVAWFLDNVIIKMLNWFNSLNFWLKIFLLIIGISTALSLVFNLARILNAIICGLMNLLFPINTFTIIIGIMFSIINSTALLIQLWRIVPYWDLWFLAEFIIIASFIISMNSMLIPRKTNYDRYN
ncbi:hypothetical protein [Flavobacterium sp. LB1P71]|uniref:hypothetical protein n=1 Tax=Flavobacterium sp. LB1P71 TaxID=3401716 RepID=UPI003AAA624C